ncbi:MAG TPA: type III-B CRISPR-associated protein Cas10/Cmr2, partial [Nannocystis exedens]|nr:type III-B CRISPR-associated protein Cas10/Cmr2 [Nannocystis exedens]
DLDGTWYYETSYDPETTLRDHDLDPHAEKTKAKKLEMMLPDARIKLDKLKKALKKLASESPQSGGVHVTPYYAVILLDVDCMGKWLDGKHPQSLKREQFLSTIDRGGDPRKITPALHREISRRQSELASDPIYTTVERHLGRVIYSGGDDLLAFVPLDTLWRCLDELRSLFRSTQGLGQNVTLSAGVAISHWRAPLSRALSLARDAESEAKNSGRNRVVVKVDRRSGTELMLPLAWPLVKHLCDLSVLADLSENASADAENNDNDTNTNTNRRLKIRLNTLEALERELETLCSFDPPALASTAIRTRVALHLTGTRAAAAAKNNSGQLLTTLLSAEVKTGEPIAVVTPPADTPPETPERPEPPPVPLVPLVPLLRLLRFLARERDPAIANASSLKSKEVT